ncbi:MAG: hypothetical protein IT285_10190 [Bdellovibrionales bacterium]|nr:hypothetical protein [Bdellovibrionales bacterium]
MAVSLLVSGLSAFAAEDEVWGPTSAMVPGDPASPLIPTASEPFRSARLQARVAVEFPWNNDQNQECGFACLYKKANELESLEVIYLARKLRVLESASDEVRSANLREFCLATGEEIGACYIRFRDFAMLEMRKAASRVEKNLVSGGGYWDSSGLGTVQGSASITIDPVSGAESPRMVRPIAPHVPSFQEMQDRHAREMSALHARGLESYIEWTGQVPNPPERSEFVLYREEPRDPTDRNGPKLRVPDRSCRRAICYDEAAYAQAVTRFEELRRTYEAPDSEYARCQTQPCRSFMPDVLSEESIGRESIQEFNEARRVIVDVANQALASRSGVPGLRGPAALGPGVGSESVGPVGAESERETRSPATGVEQVTPPRLSLNGEGVFVSMSPESIRATLRELAGTDSANTPPDSGAAVISGSAVVPPEAPTGNSP